MLTKKHILASQRMMSQTADSTDVIPNLDPEQPQALKPENKCWYDYCGSERGHLRWHCDTCHKEHRVSLPSVSPAGSEHASGASLKEIISKIRELTDEGQCLDECGMLNCLRKIERLTLSLPKPSEERAA